MSKTPAWLGLSILAVGVGVGLVYMVTGQKRTVDIQEKDKTMRPTLREKVKGKTSFKIDPTWLDNPQRGDVVAFVPPGSRKPFAARAVALPGDRISVREGKLFVNNKATAAVQRVLPVKHVPELACPRDSFYVLFDAANGASNDSAKHGPVPAWRVLGRVEL